MPKIYPKKNQPHTKKHGLLMALIAIMAVTIMTAPNIKQPISIANARILFQNDDFENIFSSGILLNSDNQNASDIAIQFGSSLAETIHWDQANGWFEFSNDVSLSSNQLLNARVENAAALPGGGSGLGAGGTGRVVQLTTEDSTAPGCGATCYPGTYVWNGTSWDVLAGGAAPPPAFDTIALIASNASAGALSTTLNIGTAGTNRVVAVFTMTEADAAGGTINITSVTVDGKSCSTELATAWNDDTSIDNRTEMWFCDESDLGASSGTVTVTASGSGAVATNWAIHAVAFEGVDQSGVNDSGLDQTSRTPTTTTTVTGIDVPEDGLVIMGISSGQGSLSINSWTSPFAQQTNAAPSSGDGFTAWGIETSAQTGKSYAATWSGTPNRSTGIVASWGPQPL